jgi:septal ring factor EnvC (AmiA/AmiB activator)
MNKRIVFSLIFFGISFINTSNLYAADAQASSSQLKSLDAQIAELQTAIQADTGKKGHLAQQLKINNIALTKLEKRSIELKHKLYEQQQALAALQTKQNDNEQQLTQQQNLLSQQLQMAYKLNLQKQNSGSFAMAQQTNAALLLTDYYYIDEARVGVIEELSQVNSQLGIKQNQVQSNKTIIQANYLEQQKSQQQLAMAAQTQQQTLTQLSTQIQGQNAKLTELINNRKALEKLILQLQKNKSLLRQPLAVTNRIILRPGLPFTALKGQLPWPIQGSILQQYGAAIGDSGLKYTGILINGHGGEDVHAVYQGRVIFANELHGFGLLLIIDQGNGYITLYGRNEVLYKKVGDVVQSQELIAKISQSNGQEPTGLYFEIRRDGQPVDPEKWLKNH